MGRRVMGRRGPPGDGPPATKMVVVVCPRVMVVTMRWAEKASW